MDYSPRQRYHARRKAIAARRKMTVLVALGCVLAAAMLGWLLWPRASAPEQAMGEGVHTAPTAAGVMAATDPASADQLEPAPPSRSAVYFNDQRLTYEPDFYVPEVQKFLEAQPSPLKRFSAPVGNRSHSFAEIIVGQSLYYSVNPRVVLALLESQGGLLSAAQPTQQQQDWALGYRTKDSKPEEDKLKGLTAQIRWAVRQLLYARRDYPAYPPLTFADESTAPAPAGWELGQYAIARALAPTTTPEKLPERMQLFYDTYTKLFGDPRPAPEGLPGIAAPFLVWPMPKPARVTSFFDHDGPFLSRNGGTFSYWGRNETDLSYDGHDGWDYAIGPPEPALAAAPGTVIFAGNADDNCATTAVVINHGNGYRTLYWHLSEVDVQIGQAVQAGDVVGTTGASGCAFGAHLHFGVQYLGRATDPYGYCGRDEDPWAENPGGMRSVWLWRDFASPCGTPPEGAVVVDTDAPGFATTGNWRAAPLGYGGGALYAGSVGPEPTAAPAATSAASATAPATPPSATATYRPALPAPGRYKVLAYVPYVINGLDDAVGVIYRIRHADGEAQLTIDMQQYANQWVDLGSFDFTPEAAEVQFDNRASTAGQAVWADAVMWVPEP